jgi:hypothetical protein
MQPNHRGGIRSGIIGSLITLGLLVVPMLGVTAASGNGGNHMLAAQQTELSSTIVQGQLLAGTNKGIPDAG